jgi:hypothetical protein
MIGRAGNIGARHGLSAAAIGTVLAIALTPAIAAFGSSRPLAGRPGATAGWAPVPYRDAQLSVPGSWLVQAPQQLGCAFPHPGGMIFAGAQPRLPKGLGCRLTTSVAWILPAANARQAVGHRRPTAIVHGIPVYRLHSPKGSVQYLVPDLAVRIGARGPQARRVLSTLRRSPLSLVLKHGAPSTAPADWTWRRFGGVWFASPRSWKRQRADQWATCGTGLVSGTRLLIDATRPPVPLPCPYQFPTATAQAAQPGLVVVTGKYAAASVGQRYSRCQVRRVLRICLSAVTGDGGALSGVLIFSVSRLHRHPATFFLLGLAGFRTPRAIFDSISDSRP